PAGRGTGLPVLPRVLRCRAGPGLGAADLDDGVGGWLAACGGTALTGSRTGLEPAAARPHRRTAAGHGSTAGAFSPAAPCRQHRSTAALPHRTAALPHGSPAAPLQCSISVIAGPLPPAWPSRGPS